MQHVGPRRPPAGTDRSGRPWAALGALLVALLAGLVNGTGCLNPRPEEDPSLQAVPNAPEASANDNQPGRPERESCGGNPLLAGCEPPATPDGASGPSLTDEPPQDEDAPVRGEPVDAGGALTDAGPADAGVTSAGSSVVD